LEYLCGLTTINYRHIALLGVYLPSSQPLSSTFYDELSAVFERLVMYNCLVVICGDFNVHVDQLDDANAARL